MKFRRLLPYFVLAAVLAWPIWNGEWSTVFSALGVGLCAGAAVSLLLYPARLQDAMLKATRPQEPRVTSLDEWDWLDRAAWEQAARAWHELGFEPRLTHVVGEKTPKLGVTVSQLWERAEQDALVEISQTLAPTRRWPLTSAVYSLWGDLERLEVQASAVQSAALADAPIASPFPVPANAPGAAPVVSERLAVTSYSTHNRPTHWIYNLFLHPQLMGTRLSGAAPDALWQTHRARRNVVSQLLQREPSQGDLARAVLAQGRVMHALWHAQFGRGFMRQMWRARRRGTRQTETWGELETAIVAKIREEPP